MTSSQLLLAVCIVVILVAIIFLYKNARHHTKSRLTNPMLSESEFTNVNNAIYTAMMGIGNTIWYMSNDNIHINQPPQLMENVMYNAQYYVNAVAMATPYSNKLMQSELQIVVSGLPTLITVIKSRDPGVTPSSYPQVDKYLPDLIKYAGLLIPNYNNIVNTPEYRAYVDRLDAITASRVLTPEEQKNMFAMFTPLNATDAIMKKMKADGVKVVYSNGVNLIGYYVYLNNILANQYNGQFGEVKQNIFQLQSSVLNLIQFLYQIINTMDKTLPEYSQLNQTLNDFVKYAKLLYGMPVIYTSPPS